MVVGIPPDPQLDGAAVWGPCQQEQLVTRAAHRERSCWAAAASVNRLLGSPAGLGEGAKTVTVCVFEGGVIGDRLPGGEQSGNREGLGEQDGVRLPDVH